MGYITAWGNALPCCISPFSTLNYAFLIMGNVFKQPLEETWRGGNIVLLGGSYNPVTLLAVAPVAVWNGAFEERKP